jgi:hypothetical protein
MFESTNVRLIKQVDEFTGRRIFDVAGEIPFLIFISKASFPKKVGEFNLYCFVSRKVAESGIGKERYHF